MVSHGQAQGRTKPSVAPFFVGLAAALVVGWWLFPKALFSEQQQPISFNHVVHIEDAGMTCDQCHYFNEDGTFHGLPTTEDCTMCHMGLMGESHAEVKFVTEYVEKEKEVDWLVYQKQPDNVYFSHAAHNMENCGMCHDYTESELCSECHPPVAEMEHSPTYYENRLTAYSKDTMKMYVCEECHAHEDHRFNTRASNACFVCHK